MKFKKLSIVYKSVGIEYEARINQTVLLNPHPAKNLDPLDYITQLLYILLDKRLT